MINCKDCKHWEPWPVDARPMSHGEGSPGPWGNCKEPNMFLFARGDDPFTVLYIVRDVFGCVFFESKPV